MIFFFVAEKSGRSVSRAFLVGVVVGKVYMNRLVDN